MNLTRGPVLVCGQCLEVVFPSVCLGHWQQGSLLGNGSHTALGKGISFSQNSSPALLPHDHTEERGQRVMKHRAAQLFHPPGMEGCLINPSFHGLQSLALTSTVYYCSVALFS